MVMLNLVLHVHIAFAVRVMWVVRSSSFNGNVKWLHIDLLACFSVVVPTLAWVSLPSSAIP